MSTKLTVEEPVLSRRSGERGPITRRRGKIIVVSGLIGLAAVGVASFNAGDSDTLPSVSVAGEPRMDIPRAPMQEVFAGCLNDIECYGESSWLPPGYWDRPGAMPSD